MILLFLSNVVDITKYSIIDAYSSKNNTYSDMSIFRNLTILSIVVTQLSLLSKGCPSSKN